MEKEMKIYHVETQEDYDDLMMELNDEECFWNNGYKPISLNYWTVCGTNCVIFRENDLLTYDKLSYAKRQYPNNEIVKYKMRNG